MRLLITSSRTKIQEVCRKISERKPKLAFLAQEKKYLEEKVEQDNNRWALCLVTKTTQQEFAYLKRLALDLLKHRKTQKPQEIQS